MENGERASATAKRLVTQGCGNHVCTVEQVFFFGFTQSRQSSRIPLLSCGWQKKMERLTSKAHFAELMPTTKIFQGRGTYITAKAERKVGSRFDLVRNSSKKPQPLCR